MSLQKSVEVFYKLETYLEKNICLPIKIIKYDDPACLKDIPKFKFEVSKAGEQFIIYKNGRLNSRVAMGCLNLNANKEIYGIMVEFINDATSEVEKNVFYEPEEARTMTYDIMSNFFGFDVKEILEKGKDENNG